MSSLGNFVKRLRDIMRNDAGINGDAQRIEQIAWLLFLKVYDTKEEDWEFDDDDYESIIPEECRWRNWASVVDKKAAMTGDDLLEFVTGGSTPPTPVKNSKKKQATGFSTPYSAATSAKVCWGPNGDHVFEGFPGNRTCIFCGKLEEFE